MRGFLRRLGRLVRWMVCAAVGLIAIFVALNAVDSRPDSAAIAAKNLQPEIVASADNLLHVVYGFDIDQPADSAADLARLGEPIIARIRQMELDGKYSLSDDVYSGYRRISYPHDLKLCNSWSNSKPDQGCLEYVRAHREAVESLIDGNAELLRRYRMLWHVPRDVFDLPRNPVVQLANWSAVMMAHRLLLAQVSLYVLDHDHRAVEELIADLKFWRHDLAESPSLIGKMLATSGLAQTMTVVGELLRNDLLATKDIAELRSQLLPLKAAERTLGPALDEEYHFHEYFVDHMGTKTQMWREPSYEPESIWSKVWKQVEGFFFLPNATTNRDFKLTLELKAHDALLCSRQTDNAPSLSGDELSWFDYLRNPTGNVMIFIGGQYQSYIQRMCNLDGLVRIVGLQAAVHEQAIAADDIGSFVEHAGTGYADPYTDHPMHWEPQRGLSFEPRGRDERTRRLLPWPI